MRHFITLIDEGDGIENPIGFCQYYDCTKSGEDWKGIPLEGVYSIDYMIGEEAFLGKGYGGEMVRQITEAVWNDTLARRIVVEPDAKNTASRASLFSNGYIYDTDLELFFKDRPLEL